MARKTTDHVAELRDRVARSRSRPGYHPYWTSSPVVADEPLWAISCRRRASEQWAGPYRTATIGLDQAIDEARAYLRVPKRAEVSVLPIVPRSDTYGGAKATLMAMMLAVPTEHRDARQMFDDLQAAFRVVDEAQNEGATSAA